MSKIVTEQQSAVYHSNKYDADIMIKRVAMILAIVSLVVGAFVLLMYQRLVSTPGVVVTPNFELKKFESNSEFQSYFEAASEVVSSDGIAFDTAVSELRATSESTAQVPERVSQTNVQVAGIDEPDIVKTDGNTIYFSNQPLYRFLTIEPSILPPDVPQSQEETTFIDALPPNEISEIASIDKSGELLLINNTLLVLSNNTIFAYDVSIPNSPKQIWDMQFDDSYIYTSRLLNNKLYIVSNRFVADPSLCPIPLFKRTGAAAITLPCTEIYHPVDLISAESTYTVMSIDPTTGVVDQRVSFVGSANSTNVYVSPNNIYVTYQTSADLSKVYFDFFITEGSGLIPNTVLTQLQQLQTYDISLQSKFNETQVILEKYKRGLSSADRIVFEQNFHNKFAIYTAKNIRNLAHTAIARIASSDLRIEATSKVSGFVLNQFSMDEHDNTFRIATTSQGSFGSAASVNDLYVLDMDLNLLGSVNDLGLGERIYSVRFIQDQAYIVTFKQIDPFYVINLKNPKNPQKDGELKIPGFSSYLHPLEKGRILGVGKEDNFVKLSLFDVTNPSSPKEITKFTLSDYHSEVIDNHRAFLLDSQNKIFFIPGTQAGYVFSYKGDKLELVTAIAEPQTKRAVYINNYLYVISDQSINVYDQNNWERIGEVNF